MKERTKSEIYKYIDRLFDSFVQNRTKSESEEIKKPELEKQDEKTKES